MTETQTKNLIRKLNKTSKEKTALEKQLEAKIKQLACQACNCSIELFNSKTRKENAVMARNLFMWYYYTNVNFNKTHSGYIVNLDHATALRAINILNENIENGLKFFKVNQRAWVQKFLSLTNVN